MRITTRLLLALAIAAAAAAAAPARADTRWAIAAGERLYLRSADQEQLAESGAREACAADHSAERCQLAEVRRDGARWSAVAVARREFFASDEHRQSSADRSALDACRAQAHFERCHITERSAPQRSEPGAELPTGDHPRAGNRDRADRPSVGGETFGFTWTLWKSESETER